MEKLSKFFYIKFLKILSITQYLKNFEFIFEVFKKLFDLNIFILNFKVKNYYDNKDDSNPIRKAIREEMISKDENLILKKELYQHLLEISLHLKKIENLN
jgi:hypothetical protein